MSKAKSNKSKTERKAAPEKAVVKEKEIAAKVEAPKAEADFAKLPKNISKELVLGSLCAELVGTFIFTVCLLNCSGNIIVAALVMVVLVMTLSRVSGGHINPVITISLWATRQISGIKAAGYVISQILGAMLALVIVTQFVNATPVSDTTGLAASVYTATDLTGQWRPFFGELLGGLALGFGVAAAFFGRKNSLESGFIIGGGLLSALIIAALGSSAIVNPAAAIGLSAYTFDNWWTIFAYAIAPVIGGALGAWLYKLLQWDVTGQKELTEE